MFSLKAVELKVKYKYQDTGSNLTPLEHSFFQSYLQSKEKHPLSKLYQINCIMCYITNHAYCSLMDLDLKNSDICIMLPFADI